MTVHLRERGVTVVLLDIEGTTTPLRFVSDVLFPYARQRLRPYVAARLPIGELKAEEHLLEREWKADTIAGNAPPPWDSSSEETHARSIADYAEWLMDRDRKSTGLKVLQGLIWRGGYRDGALVGDVFADVPPALERWHAAGIETAIYSSGSVLAQRLLFGNTRFGDLAAGMSEFFDTGIGPKVEPQSYDRVTEALECRANQILFVSDAPAELEAAGATGLQTLFCIRPGNNPPPPGHQFETLHSFEEIVA